jgi:ATP phosphoribosyltransferase
VPISGAAEIAPHLGVADIIVDLVSTGSTLKMNGLVEIAPVLESAAQLIARPDAARRRRTARADRASWWPRSSPCCGRRTSATSWRTCRSVLAEIKRILPGINGPTILDVLDGGEFVAAHAVVDQRDIYRTIAELKGVGAQGILVTRIERLMP